MAVVAVEESVPSLEAGADDVAVAMELDEGEADESESPIVPDVLQAARPMVRIAAAIAGYFMGGRNG